jgi:ABC-type antimicrobial peptide transport system permease subunit
MNMIIKNLLRRKTRTLLTILGIAVGVAAVVALSAFGEGLARGFEQISVSPTADITVAQRDAMMVLMSALDEEIGDELAQLPGVDEVTGTVIGIVQMENAPYFFVVGEDPRGFSIKHYHLVVGQRLAGRRQMLLGAVAAKNFKKSVGDKFRFNNIGYRVVGIYETGNTFEDGGAVISLSDAQRAFDRRNQVSYFNLNVKDPRRIDALKREIETRWTDLTAIRSGESNEQQELFELYRSLGWFLGIFAVLVGGLGMMNATLMSVFERTREIGVLRALGWRRRRVLGMIVGESLLLALLGGIVGIGLGVGLTLLVRLSPAVASMLEGVLTPAIFAQALIVALVLGVVGGLYPAWRAVQLAPVEAMRQESGVGIHWSRGTEQLARLLGDSSLRNLLRRPLRTLMTAIGLGVGVGFVVTLMAVVAGAKQSMTALAGAGQADLFSQQANVSDMSLSAIDERVAAQIRLRPEVKSVSRIFLGITSAPGLQFLMVYGLDPQESYFGHFRVREGRPIARPREVMLGRLAANNLEKRIGDSLRLGSSSYDIVGIFENGVSYEDMGGVIAMKEAQRMFGKPRKVSFIVIALDDPTTADRVALELEQAFPSIIVSKTANMTDRMQDFASMNAMFNALTTLIVIVGGVVMMNVMMMSVFECTQEIGVLRALGWRRRRVLRMVLIEALALSLLSAIAGIAIGFGLGALLALEPTYGPFLPSVYSPPIFAGTFALALALGVLGGLYPSWRAASMRPIEALRYE